MTKLTSFHAVCKQLLASSANEYAKSYAKAGLKMFDSDAISVQAMYILSNLSTWRDPEAKAIRAKLRAIQ